MFATMNYKAKTRVEKIGSIVAIAIFCFCAGFVTYTNMLEQLKH
jgi:hypothetical protein